MPDEVLTEEDHYEPAPLAEPQDVDEEARLRRIDQGEDAEARREILLGRITVARGKLYEAQDDGDEAQVATLRAKLDALTSERDAL